MAAYNQFDNEQYSSITNQMPRPTTARAAPAPAADSSSVRSWLSVVQAYHLCDALLARRLGALGVKTPEHEILANLRRDPGITQQTLAARCFSAKSHISGLLSALEERGWVRREPDPADARAKRLYLAPAGARMAERTVAAQAEVVALMAGAIPAAQMAEVTDAMQRVAERLQAALAQRD
jgi:DNA-binding MarR family transcriptional regulator